MIISKDCDLIDTEEYECCEECYELIKAMRETEVKVKGE